MVRCGPVPIHPGQGDGPTGPMHAAVAAARATDRLHQGDPNISGQPAGGR